VVVIKAIRIHETGGPEVMRLEEIEKPKPSACQVLIKVAAAGVNYADLMQRQGTYLTPTKLPMTLGLEVAATVEELGEGVTSLPVGTRVAALVEGGYAEYALAYPNMIIPIPETLDFVHAAALPLQGITAYRGPSAKAPAFQPGDEAPFLILHPGWPSSPAARSSSALCC
jgi:NADPH2:quinone reductase